MSGGILGAFASLDLFFFYFLHELALVPTFIMIGVWGRGERKNYATFQITLYLSIGALIALIGLIALYLQSGANTFDIPKIIEHVQDKSARGQRAEFHLPAAAVRLRHSGFALAVPFLGAAGLRCRAVAHRHAPRRRAEEVRPLRFDPHRAAADAAGRAELDALSRVALPRQHLYVGWVAMRQKDLNLLIGNSSVAHMGFIFLGIASLNLIGVTGAVLIMIAHGFLAALTFALSGYIYQQTGTLEMSKLGGLCRKLPFIGTALLMAAMAGCGLPGFANFVGEVTVFFGAWKVFPVVTGIALWGALLIGALYMLRAIRNILHGPLPEKWNSIPDASNVWRKLPYALLLASLFVFGVWPTSAHGKNQAGRAKNRGDGKSVPETPSLLPVDNPNVRNPAIRN